MSQLFSYEKHNDAELVSLIKLDDEAAFDEIYRRYWKSCYNDAYRRLRNAELCEELIQDVFADLWIKRSVKHIDHLSQYIAAAVRYQVFMQYKKGQRMPVFEEPMEHILEESLGADTMHNLKELKAQIEDWLFLQPAKRGQVFKMRFMEEYTTKEISAILGISQKTVQNQLLTSVDQLKKHLQKASFFVSIVLLFQIN